MVGFPGRLFKAFFKVLLLAASLHVQAAAALSTFLPLTDDAWINAFRPGSN